MVSAAIYFLDVVLCCVRAFDRFEFVVYFSPIIAHFNDIEPLILQLAGIIRGGNRPERHRTAGENKRISDTSIFFLRSLGHDCQVIFNPDVKIYRPIIPALIRHFAGILSFLSYICELILCSIGIFDYHRFRVRISLLIRFLFNPEPGIAQYTLVNRFHMETERQVAAIIDKVVCGVFIWIIASFGISVFKILNINVIRQLDRVTILVTDLAVIICVLR